MAAVVRATRPVPPTIPPINSNAIAATQLPAATAIRKGAGDGARGEFIAPEA
jgi:hypothetical protein